MKFKRFPKNDYTQKQNSYQEALQTGSFSSIPELSKSQSLNYSAPKSIPPRKGKLLAIAITAAVLGYSGYSVWNTYLRYDSFGIVDSARVGIYSKNTGFISDLNVKEGSTVKSGDIVALVVNPEDQRSLNKVNDELSVAEADLSSKREEIVKNNNDKVDSIFQIKSTIIVEEGLISNLIAQLKLNTAEANRLKSLLKDNAASEHEYETVVSSIKQIKSTIESKKRYIESLKLRQKNNQNVVLMDTSVILSPLEKKILLLKNEKERILGKINDGKVISPVSGVVSQVSLNIGEKVGDNSIFTVIVDNTTDLVLFYDPASYIPTINSEVNVLSLSEGKYIPSRVTAVSKDVVSPPEQIKRNYYSDQKLVKVYLKPLIDNTNFLISGSVIKKPKPQDILLQPIKFVFNLLSDNALASNKSE